jgi:hypothetical protein
MLILLNQVFDKDLNSLDNAYLDNLKALPCQYYNDGGIICKLVNVSMTVEPGRSRGHLIVNLNFTNRSLLAFTATICYAPSVPYDPNIKKFEDYLKQLVN